MRLAGQRGPVSLVGVLVLCGASGVLLALCFPPAGLWFLAWVALVPWLVGVRVGSNWSAAIGSWLGGFIFFGILLYWLVLFGVSVWAMAALLLGVWLMVWGVFTRLGGRLGPGLRVVGAAVLWCGVEWGRGLGQFGFTWGWLGYSQSQVLGLMPVVRVAGTLGLSFLIALVNSALAEAAVGRVRGEAGLGHAARVAAACGLVVLSLVGAKSWVGRQGEPGGPAVRVAVIQGSAHGPLRAEQVNVPLTPEERRRTLEIYGSLTGEAAGVRPMLVVWPESVLPGVPGEEPWVSGRAAEAARSSGAWLLAGGPHRDEQGRPRNSAYLYAPSGHQRDRYDKVQLVPFGEYVPGRGWLPLLSHYHVRDEDFAAGLQHRALQAGMMAVGPMICFESIFPRISWQLTQQGAQVLVIITNDAWFGRTAAAAQHRQIAVLRAVETNRWVVRGASTGISSIIAPDGRIVAEAGLFEREWISADIRLASERSGGEARETGMGWGPVFSWGVFCLAIGFILVSAVGPGGPRSSAAGWPAAARSSNSSMMGRCQK